MGIFVRWDKDRASFSLKNRERSARFPRIGGNNLCQVGEIGKIRESFGSFAKDSYVVVPCAKPLQRRR